MFDLTGRLALVTGASGGIGGAVARALHAQGARLVLTGRRRDALEALAGGLGGGGGGVTVHACDVAEPGAADELVKAAEAAGGLDILVNNAGVARDGLALRLKDEDWREVLETNLGAAFRLSRAALRGMMRRRYGRIVNMTSVVAVTGNPGQANYAAAKAGMIGMAKALAAEVAGRGITVNCVAPGLIESAMTDALDGAQRTRILERVPVGRLGSGDDVAAAVVYLASTEAGYVTGQTLHVNGGLAMV
ncbi:MAG TPA: 3-oxoacyl-ACP reductase FabG [Geminicoccaceae bacterium]|nr:3-oxoacyl-ACP reductase FabG [Geminicoccaceae bacterium]